MVKTLIVAGRVKELAKIDHRELNVSAAFAMDLSTEVEKMIERACHRAVLNGRTTIMSRDI